MGEEEEWEGCILREDVEMTERARLGMSHACGCKYSEVVLIHIARPWLASSSIMPACSYGLRPSPIMSFHSSFLIPLPVSTSTRNPSPTALAHAALQPGEEWIYAQDGVGLYRGSAANPDRMPTCTDLLTHRNTKISTHQVLSVQLTTHRLLFICSESNTSPHLQVRLADIRQIEHYTGFLRSSPKVTLQLGASSSVMDGLKEGRWTCGVCGCQNDEETATTMTLGLPKCRLCGIARSEKDTSPVPSSTPPSIACPRCTFLNSPTRTACELCTAKLPTATAAAATEKPASAPEVVRISFRRGGDKEVYRRLKVVLASRTWERRSAGDGERTGTPSRGIGIGERVFLPRGPTEGLR